MLQTPHEIHQKAEELREKDQLLEALKLYPEAIIGYQKEQDYKNIVEAFLGTFLTYKHLFLLTKDKVFFILGKSNIEAAYQIADENKFDDKLGTVYFSSGELYMLIEDFPKSIENFQKALEHYVGPNSMKGDYTYHLGEALYKNGDKESGEEKLLVGLDLIKKYGSEVEPFVFHVWESGCYLRLAEVLFTDKPQDSKMYLDKAKEIIDADPMLIIRKRQYQDLNNTLRKKQMNLYQEESLL